MNELENMWNGKKFDPQADKAKVIDSLYQKIQLEKLHKRQKNIFAIKVAIVAIILLTATFILYNYQGMAKITLIFYTFFLMETGAIFYVYFRHKFSVSNDMFLLPALQFSDKILRKFSREKIFIKLWLPIYVIALVVQLNVLFIFSIRNVSAINRLIFHFLLTGFVMLVFIYSLNKRMKRYNNEIKPLAEKFETLKTELSNN